MNTAPAAHQMTPVAMEILIHHYYNPTPIDVMTVSQENAFEYLVRHGLVEFVGGKEAITERGRILVEHWKDCPLLVQSWVVPKNVDTDK